MTQHSMKASTRCGCYLMPENSTPSLVRAYSARPREGLSLRDLIFTKLTVDFYLSKAYVSRLQERSGIMVIHRNGSTAPTAARPVAAETSIGGPAEMSEMPKT